MEATMLRVGVLCSYRAPALTHVLSHGPGYLRSYDIMACVTSEPSFADTSALLSHGIPLHLHSVRRFCDNFGVPSTDRVVRRLYDDKTRMLLQQHRIDVVVTDAYLYLLTDPMLRAYDRRIINLHHSDLTCRDAGGQPRFKGLRAVRDAILGGERSTRATAHLVTPELDEGPPFLRSWRFPVAPLAGWARQAKADDVLKAYIHAHQEWMIRSTWGPLMDAALTLIADGRVDLDAIAEAGAVDEVWQLEEDGSLVPPLAAATVHPGTMSASTSAAHSESMVGAGR
jgi:folate-dependent phosphoribosylglycinamide formyltransferase PurN